MLFEKESNKNVKMLFEKESNKNITQYIHTRRREKKEKNYRKQTTKKSYNDEYTKQKFTYGQDEE